jgi:hypothetical protein
MAAGGSVAGDSPLKFLSAFSFVSVRRDPHWHRSITDGPSSFWPQPALSGRRSCGRIIPPVADPPLVGRLLLAELPTNRSPILQVQVRRQMQTAGKNPASELLQSATQAPVCPDSRVVLSSPPSCSPECGHHVFHFPNQRPASPSLPGRLFPRYPLPPAGATLLEPRLTSARLTECQNWRLALATPAAFLVTDTRGRARYPPADVLQCRCRGFLPTRSEHHTRRLVPTSAAIPLSAVRGRISSEP